MFKLANRTEQDKEKRDVGSDLAKLGGDDLRKLTNRHRIQPKHIVVLWFEESIGDLLRSLSTFAPSGSSVTVVSRAKPEVKLAPTLFTRLPASLFQERTSSYLLPSGPLK